MLKNEKLCAALKAIDPDLERLWYLDEKALDAGKLLSIYRARDDARTFRHALESVWRAEICRRAAILLATLAHKYRGNSGEHWKFVHKVKSTSQLSISIWKQIPQAFAAFAKFDESRVRSIQDLQGEYDDLFSKSALQCVQYCLKDIKGQSPWPVVGIEPIDTPTSALEEDVSLAQEVITALLNVYVADFQPDTNQHLDLYLSIPWHRYSSKAINFPQKLIQYKSYLEWSPKELRDFINRRIEWEFKRVHRQFTGKGMQDAWSTLFEPTVRNEHCRPIFNEDSFEYVLRHTHHRPRDLQRLARKSVEHCKGVLQRDADDILSGASGIKVNGVHIRDAIASCTRETTDSLVTEAARRFPSFSEITERLRGITVPFTTDDLRKRLPGIDIARAIDELWQSGVMGVEVIVTDDNQAPTLPKQTLKINKDLHGREHKRYYFFEYNWDGEANELLMRYRSPGSEVRCVLHPKTFEYLLPANVTSEYPIGI